MTKICPICKKSKIYSINPVETRNRLKELLKSAPEGAIPDDLNNIIKELGLENDISEEEMTFYSVQGNRNVCTCCGFAFCDNDESSKYLNEVFTPVTQEEYYDYIRSKVNDETYSFLMKKALPQEEYYLIVADQLISELNEVGLTELNDELVN